jgi:hypothetical protein
LSFFPHYSNFRAEHYWVAGYYDLLAHHGDHLRGEPERRLAPGSPYFRFDLLFSDGAAVRHALFVADDSAAVYGVLRVVYADVQGG